MSDVFRPCAGRAVAALERVRPQALARKYAGSFAAPEPRSELGDADRMYLRRYAVENSLPASRYLTAELARKLATEGAAIAGLSTPPSPAAPPPLPSRYRDYFAMCAQASGEEAIAACDYAITSGIYRGVDLGRVYNNRGVEYAHKRDLDRAIADSDRAIRLNPQFADAYHNRGIAWGQKGYLDRAIADFDQVIRLNPEYADAYYNRAAIWGKKGYFNRAIAEFDAALKIFPNHARSLYGRGLVKLLKGDVSGNADIAAAKAIQADITGEFAPSAAK